jgi:TonB-linked SusC/RagA family outer membrane protein
MKRKLHLFAMLFGLALALNAQAQSVTGKVTDMQSGEALPGVAIRIKGTTRGAVTDLDGMYNVQASGTDTLQFSFIGYLEEVVPVGNRTTINVQLSPDVETLSEVVVVGYGEQKKSLVTGAISSVRAEELATVSNTRVEQALQGRTAGVTVLPSSGSPGSGMSIRVRGTGSNRSANPLFIVDGMRAGGIEYLDPSEIASVEVLKDAASAAIYGAEGANGVVIITTKTGKSGVSDVSYHGQYGIQSVGNLMPLMNARQYQEYLEEAGAPGRPSVSDVTDEVGTNWFDEIFDTAPQQSHSLTFSGGSEKSTYLIGGTYFNQKGIVGGDKSSFDRFTLRLNTDHKVRPWLNVGERLSFSHFSRSSIAENSEFGGLITSALVLDPLTPVVYSNDPATWPLHLRNALAGTIPNANDAANPFLIADLLSYDQNGNYYGISNFVRGEYGNPVARIANTNGDLNQNKIVGNVFADIMPIDGLKFTTRFGIDAAFQRQHGWSPRAYYSLESYTPISNANDRQDNWFTWQWENFVNYNKQLGDHDFGVLLGTSALRSKWNYVGGSFSDLFKERDDFSYADYVPNATDLIGSNSNSSSMASVFGRITYNYKEKYLLNATLRRDGSSRLSEGNKWGNFPSVSAGWTVSNEDFYPSSLSGIMNSAKLRASWGQNGSIGNIGIGEWMSTVSPTTPGYPDALGNLVVGAAPRFVSNEELRWETSEQIDFGADLAFLKNRVFFTVDYFVKTTKDLLTGGISPGYTGLDLPVTNGGTVENKGWEFELSYRSDATRSFQYEIGGNLTTLKNEVTYLDPNVPRINGAGVGTGWTATIFEEGYPIWYYSGYKTDGIFQNQDQIDSYLETTGVTGYNPNPGDPVVVDVNDDNKIDVADQTFIGSPHPDMIFGGRVNLRFKGFDFLVFAQGQVGNEILMGFNRTDRQTANRPEFFYTNRWTGENSTNNWFAANTGSAFVYNSDLMVFDGSYVRVRQLQLGYTLPNTLMKRLSIKNVRVYATLDNYFTFTNYPGIDPEVGEGNGVGIDRGAYPIPRKVLGGLQFSF